MNVQLTEAQRLQQQLINGFITDLERQVQNQGAAPVNMDLGNMLNGLLSKFDSNKDSRFNSNELTSLAGHLRRLNTEQNIAQLFTADGQINFATASQIDITGDGKFNGQEDLVALQQILATRSSTSASQTVSSASSGQVSAGIGNATNGIQHFNNRGSFFVTEGGFTILTDTNVGGHQTDIYDNAGRMITRIWGDPHVGDGTTAAGGWNWHFGNDSTFILPDGTEIMFNTEGNANNNVYVTTGLYIKSGNDVYQTGQDFGTKTTGVASDAKTRNSSITKLAMSATEFDARYADAGADANGAGVFAWTRSANNGAGGWAILTEGGVFQDVKNESWGDYLRAGGASFRGQYEGVVQASKAQMIAALDGDAVRSFDIIKQNIKDVPGSNPPIKSDDLFLEYYFKHGANTKELKTFADMVANGSSASKMQFLDDYIKNGTDIQLSDSQESKFLNYLVTPATTKIAETYLGLIEDGADAKKFELLDNLATGKYNMTSSQQDTFLNYLTNFDNTKLAEIYASIIEKGGNQDSLNLLENYASGNLGVNLSTEQENKMLNYLSESSNSNIARTYINFVRDGASSTSLQTLDDIFTSAGSAREVLTEDDLRFGKTLNVLSKSYKLSGNYYDKIIDNFDTVPVDQLNSVLDKIIELNENASVASQAKTQSIDLLTALISVVQNPTTALFNIDSNNAQAIFMNSSLGKNADITKEILESQLLLLNDMSQTDPAVIAAKQKTNMMLGWIPDYLTNPDPETDNLNSTEKGIYNTFISSFPAGTSPSQAQKDAVLELIDGDYALGDNVAFMASYSKLVASGDNASAFKLAEIAKFYGDGAISSYTKVVSNSNISAETVDAAYSTLELMKEMQEQNPSAFKNVIAGNASNFLLKTLLDGKGGYSAGEGAEAKAFVEALKDALGDQPNTMTDSEMSIFIHTSLREFDKDLGRNGNISFSSRTEIIAKNKAAQNSFNQDSAEIQINIFESMINFYNSQIAQENAKPEPDTGKISKLNAQVSSHRSAISALQKIAS